MPEFALQISRYRNEELVDIFTLNYKGDGAVGVFNHVKRLPCVITELVEGAVVVDLLEDGDLNTDPITISPASDDWFLFTFLRLGRKRAENAIRDHRRHIDEIRQRYAAKEAADVR